MRNSTAVCLAIVGMSLGMCTVAFAQQRDELAVIGEQLWKTRVNCMDCHGSLGNGEAEDPRSPAGANLRQTALTVEQIAEVIQCGRPSTVMPFFDRRAYSDNRCYGLTAADLGDNAPRAGLPQLSAREIGALASFVKSQFAGKGPVTFEECVAFWGEGASSCASYQK